mmetsp:Transcript_14285/g.39532  ORF Transcript_14285/g.39532 Transcript_14285/m.39532 type:complete len:424 (-) Transcript_14285:224-1495(-)
MVYSVGLGTLQGCGERQRALEAPAGALHELSPLPLVVPGPGTVAGAALADHGRGVPPRDVRREVREGQPHDAAVRPAAAPRACRVAAHVLPAQPVHKSGARALHRVLTAPHVLEDFLQGLHPERVPLGARHDRIADEPRGALLQEHRMDEVFLAQQHTSPDLGRSGQEGIQGLGGLDVYVRVDSTEDVQDRDAGNVCALDARHAVVALGELREALLHERPAPAVVPELEAPLRVKPAPRCQMPLVFRRQLVRLPGLVQHFRNPPRRVAGPQVLRRPLQRRLQRPRPVAEEALEARAGLFAYEAVAPIATVIAVAAVAAVAVIVVVVVIVGPTEVIAAAVAQAGSAEGGPGPAGAEDVQAEVIVVGAEASLHAVVVRYAEAPPRAVAEAALVGERDVLVAVRVWPEVRRRVRHAAQRLADPTEA